MPKVYVVNDSALDFSPAEKFGTLVMCSKGRFDRFDLNQMHRELSDAMKDSAPEDFILLTSLTAMCCVACAIFASQHGQINLLLYLSQEQDYLPRTIILHKDEHGKNSPPRAVSRK